MASSAGSSLAPAARSSAPGLGGNEAKCRAGFMGARPAPSAGLHESHRRRSSLRFTEISSIVKPAPPKRRKPRSWGWTVWRDLRELWGYLLAMIKSQRTPPPRAVKTQVTSPEHLKSVVLGPRPHSLASRFFSMSSASTWSSPGSTKGLGWLTTFSLARVTELRRAPELRQGGPRQLRLRDAA